MPYIRNLADEIHASIIDYFDGNVGSCYKRLEEIIAKEKYLFENLIADDKDQKIIQKLHSRGLFRLRKIKNAKNIVQRSELFHVPFDLRGKAASARYSIPGLPCLYLSASLHIAKKELNLKRLHSVYVSRYSASPNFSMRILDFKYQSELLGRWGFQYFDSQILPRVVFWPLIASCSIAVRNPEFLFKPVYIIPQFLFQIGSALFNFNGIRYFSTKGGVERPVNINFAIKVKHSQPSGYCTLRKRCNAPAVIANSSGVFELKFCR